MRVFVSWSGERSKRVAELLQSWLEGVIQRLDIWVSLDIDRGAIWFMEINEAIKDVETGIICLTKENLNAPWILFEAGALARGISSNRVCTMLIDLEVKSVTDPLAQFNHTKLSKDSMLTLVKTLNSRLGADALKDEVLHSVFELHWPLFDEKLKSIISETEEGSLPQKSDADILQELLSKVNSIETRLNRPMTSVTIDGATGTLLGSALNNRLSGIGIPELSPANKYVEDYFSKVPQSQFTSLTQRSRPFTVQSEDGED